MSYEYYVWCQERTLLAETAEEDASRALRLATVSTRGELLAALAAARQAVADAREVEAEALADAMADAGRQP